MQPIMDGAPPAMVTVWNSQPVKTTPGPLICSSWIVSARSRWLIMDIHFSLSVSVFDDQRGKLNLRLPTPFGHLPPVIWMARVITVWWQDHWQLSQDLARTQWRVWNIFCRLNGMFQLCVFACCSHHFNASLRQWDEHSSVRWVRFVSCHEDDGGRWTDPDRLLPVSVSLSRQQAAHCRKKGSQPNRSLEPPSQGQALLSTSVFVEIQNKEKRPPQKIIKNVHARIWTPTGNREQSPLCCFWERFFY